jgi:acetamidase/formamidase
MPRLVGKPLNLRQHPSNLARTGGQIKNSDDASDVRDVDLTQVHYLSGPFEIASAEPGDVLVVEIQDVQPLPEQPWGFTGVFAKENGGGFLDEHYPKPYVARMKAKRTMLKQIVQRQSGILKAFSVRPATFQVCAFRA